MMYTVVRRRDVLRSDLSWAGLWVVCRCVCLCLFVRLWLMGEMSSVLGCVRSFLRLSWK